MRKLLLIALISVSLLVMSSCGGGIGADDYLTSLFVLRGTSYWTLHCSNYITTAKHFRHCGASEFWSTGCGGALVTVEKKARFEEVNTADLLPGDVVAFHGVHVAAYVGNGHFLDSDPNHYGVGDMTPDAIHGDLWFAGQVKILRWKN